MRLYKVVSVTIVSLMSICTLAADKISIVDLPKHAIEQSQLTLTGSRPFHLKARIVEATNLDNDDYKAEVEEYWLAPDKWRRTVKTSEFSQTLIVNGDKVSEQIDGGYYPHWLYTMVNAIFDPGAALQGIDMSKSPDNPMIGGTKFCRRFAFRAGIAPVGNNVFSTYCFDSGLLDSVGKPGYDAEYGNYKKFAEKQVARKIREYIESGTELEATIYELTELGAAEESLFAIRESTAQLRRAIVSEETIRALSLSAPAMQWPAISGGKSSGVLSIYLCIDREGLVRETYPLNSDNPFMSDAARKQLMNWRFKPASNGGVLVQVESILTFAYETRIESRLPNSTAH
jgi:hypothetical protein